MLEADEDITGLEELATTADADEAGLEVADEMAAAELVDREVETDEGQA
jgi:hypothetical protein